MEEEIVKALRTLHLPSEAIEELMQHFSTLPYSVRRTEYHSAAVPRVTTSELPGMIALNKVDKIIKEASLEMCLTSKYLYIRECKKWYEEHKEAKWKK